MTRALATRPLSPRQLYALFPWIPAGPVLDLGAGTGSLSQLFSHYGFAVTAVEKQPELARQLAITTPALQVVCADFRALELGQARWAALCCFNLFPFVPRSEHATELQRLGEALKPEGLLIFSGFSPQDPSAGGALALDRQGHPQTTGTLDLEQLQAAFTGWELLFAFQGPVADDHPPSGLHYHDLVQVILRKPPRPLPVAWDWQTLPFLGAGLGWRPVLDPLLREEGVADFIEIMSDDFLDPCWDASLLELSRRYTVIPHGVELSPGSCEGPDSAYLEQIKRLTRRCDSPWWSDHLCYTRSQGVKTWSLNPLPATEEAAEQVIRQARAAMQAVGRPLLLENPAYYWRPELSGQMEEGAFFRCIVEQADCGILLDVANLYGNAHNLGLDPLAFIQALPGERVVQIHIAGGRHYRQLLFDTHDHPVQRQTWELLQYALRHCDIKAISLERDEGYQDLRALVEEVAQARHLLGVRV